MDDEITSGNGGRKKVIAITIVLTVVIASIGAYVLLTDGGGSTYPNHFELFWDTEYTETAWLVKVVDVKNSPPGYQGLLRPGDLKYGITNKETWEHLEGFNFVEITNKTSPLGVTWVDVNNNGFVEIGDYLRINRSGGNGGMVNLDRDELVIAETGFSVFIYPSNYVYLPPAEFLDMDVVKTATGWNMTVTWVNETIPEGFMEGWRIGFRLENESEAFYGIQKFGWAVPLGNIESNFVAEPGTYDAHNMTYYYIDWFDNNMDNKFSVNDTILIDKSSEIKDTLNFIFSSSQYGYHHVIFEVTLP
jgi:hypothetical protein